MSNEDLSRKPKHLRCNGVAEAWFYEEPKGLELIVDTDPGGQDRRGKFVHVRVPWATIRASLKRKDA